MNTKLEKIENNVVRLEITVDNEKFQEAMKKSYKKNAKNFNIPGFRKGKAPMNIINRYYGESVFYEDAIDFICQDTYPEAVKENDLNPVDYPEIDIVQVGEDKEFIYTAKVVVRPEVELGDYKGIEVKKVEYEVSDSDVDAQLKAMQEKNSRIEKKEEGSVENDDIAVIDFKGYVDGVAFEGGEGKDYSLEIGSGSFIDNFEEQLIGLKAGENKNVSVKFPDEYGKPELNGKQAVFEVTVKEIKTKEKPALDDEFAKEVSEFDTLAELKADIVKKMVEANTEKAKAEYEAAVVDAVADNAKIDIPEIMIKNETDVMLRDLEFRLSYQGLDLKTYYEYTNNTEEKVREMMRESAERRVKTDMVLEKIAQVEKVEASEEEIEAKANENASQYGDKDKERIAKQLLENQKDYLKNQIINEKVINMLVENSKAV